ncbi:MAG: anhydro-N-acetylmuramic acid kinase [bacterium]|nr:anhydro-N-acetylmuramic acid kinase [bacterium]
MSWRRFFEIELERPAIGCGLMSGTSVDAVDAALVEIMPSAPSPVRLIHYHEMSIPAGLKDRILAAMKPGAGGVDHLCQLNVEVANVFADAALETIVEADVPIERVSFIASHGQTVYHVPRADEARGWATPSSLQLGAPSVIAERTGLTTIGNFRLRDMAAGGVGAPLIPYAEAVMFGRMIDNVICLNIGGIANCTLIRQDGSVIAFDCGPGNMVMDAIMRRMTGEPFDENGRLAASGKVIPALLEEALKHPFFQQAPPKATGHEDFGELYADWFITHSNHASTPDLMATAMELTAQSITHALREFVIDESPARTVILSGGGAMNAALIERLRGLSKDLVWRKSDEYGFAGAAKEAMGFAILGFAALHGTPNTIPSATGAAHAVVAGEIAPGRTGTFHE